MGMAAFNQLGTLTSLPLGPAASPRPGALQVTLALTDGGNDIVPADASYTVTLPAVANFS